MNVLNSALSQNESFNLIFYLHLEIAHYVQQPGKLNQKEFFFLSRLKHIDFVYSDVFQLENMVKHTFKNIYCIILTAAALVREKCNGITRIKSNI